MGAKVAAAFAAVALSSASASIVGVVYTGVVSVRYDSGGASNYAVANRARFGNAAGLTATNVRFGPGPDSQVESGSPCQDDSAKGCFVLFPSPELKFSFFGHTISLPAEWDNVDWGEDLYRGGEQQFVTSFSTPDLVMSKNSPDSTGQEDAATVVASDDTSRQTQTSNSIRSWATPTPFTIQTPFMIPTSLTILTSLTRSNQPQLRAKRLNRLFRPCRPNPSRRSLNRRRGR